MINIREANNFARGLMKSYDDHPLFEKYSLLPAMRTKKASLSNFQRVRAEVSDRLYNSYIL